MIRFTAVIQEEGKAPRALAYESGLESITLGRDSKCEFQIPVPTISRQHCRVYFRDDAYIIQDLRSTYGTLVNEKKLEGDEKKVLNTGDIIELTNVRITVSIEIANKDEDETVGISEKTQALAAKAVEEILSGIGRSQDQDECPYLRVLNGVDEGVRFVFGNSNEWYLGRSKDCDFIVNDPNISRRHAIIRKDWQGYYVEDLGSKNGVLVNDKKVVKRRFLKHRDELLIGPVKLLFVDPNYELLNAIDQIEGFENGADEEEAVNDKTMNAEGSVADIEPPVSSEDGEKSNVGDGSELSPEGEASPNSEDGQSEDDYPDDIGDIDEDLLEPVAEKSSLGLIAMIGGGVVILICIILIILLI